MVQHEIPSARRVLELVWQTLSPERRYLWLAVIYGVGISLLSLATPIAVQVLINTVAYTGLTTPLAVLTIALFGLLLTWALLNALRVHLVEIFARRFYARCVAAIALRTVYAKNPFFADEGQTALFNRYFDILGVQKAVPVLVIGGFTVLLQASVGFVLVSFYHPYFFVFVAVIVAAIWLIWLVWGASAIRTAVALSVSKHRTAAWIEGLGGSNGYFKSDRHVTFALHRTEEVTAAYVDAHKRHFRRHFAQTVSFLVLYAAANATLLGLGGWLVIQGQLTLGQLVAAELVLSAAFYGVAQLGTYLNYFYDLCAACEELSLFEAVDEEDFVSTLPPSRTSAELVFDSVRGDARGLPALLDFVIPSGTTVQAAASLHGTQRLFTNLLKRFEEPRGGTLTLGGDDITATEVHVLRREIVVLDRPSMVEMTIRQYLALSRDGVSSSDMLNAIRDVGLAGVIESLERGLDTSLSSTGWPLAVSEIMRLKLAAAILSKPLILILNQLYDTVPDHMLRRAIEALKQACGGTVVVFTNRAHDLGADSYLYLEPERQRLYTDYAAFEEAQLGQEALTGSQRTGANSFETV
ncbi:ABC transporter ATP-binding protein [Parvularcula dongshanensis]|uniref:Putative ABC transport system ATP-binding protein n=1 Tax=Parvularcula dongshanensis TaxID=1173995 RepID=A0A840I5Q0_9PROT|nr:ABC transporter ATP-binding protein [Parvularcula dongshanensis]MBB4660276.1 putative ABC transport system ATP-binding protein [Parvularcula dongshanensis]